MKTESCAVPRRAERRPLRGMKKTNHHHQGKVANGHGAIAWWRLEGENMPTS